MAILSWEIITDGVAFNCFSESGKLDVQQWGGILAEDTSGRNLNVGPLLISLENEESILLDDSSLLLPWSVFAQLDPLELKQIGLPTASQFQLKISGSGVLLKPGFVFNYQFWHPAGRPVMGLRRQGAIISVASQQFSLLDPIYTLAQMMDSFNALPPDDLEQRLLVWGKMKEILPEDAIVDEFLKGINIAPADSFTLELNESGGEAAFDPVLVKAVEAVNSSDPSDQKIRSFELLLPEVTQEGFAKRFNISKSVSGRYSLPGGWYVAIPPSLKKALSICKDMQSRPVEERRAFFANPRYALKQALSEELDEESIDALFFESPEFLSDRIKYLGYWEPKVGAFLFSSKQQWLGGPEELGLPLGNNTIVRIPVNEIPDLLHSIKQAQKEGKPTVSFKGQTIPATDETIKALSFGQPQAKPEIGETGEKGEPEKETSSKIVPIIKDNIADEEYSTLKKERNGSVQQIPFGLKSDLLPHQRQGLFWLQENWVAGNSGVLLADDMGLGKTFQALAFLQWVKLLMDGEHWGRQPFLVVAPTGLLKNWEEEAGKHLAAPGLGGLLRAYGSSFKPYRKMTDNRAAKDIKNYDWVLTTYETLRDYINIFIKVDWSVTFFDEVQKIKNPAAMMTDMAKSLKSEFTVALTGTPVENRLADLWCIVDTVQPGLLHDLKSFSKKYESDDGSIQEENCAELKKLLVESPPRVMLRRLKEDHLQGLPEKKSRVIEKEMPSVQAIAYQQAILNARSAGKQKGKMLQAIQNFRSISLHPFLYDGSVDNDSYVESSARLMGTFEILDEIANKKEKVLIFVESKHMQQWIVPYIQKRYALDHAPMVINGAVSGPKRQERVRIFQDSHHKDFDVMVLSPKAGGVGLTLTAANHVIHLSRWWNPAVEDQCTDRVFRIGQKNNVSVYYPMAIHPELPDISFDANLNRLLERKRTLSREVLAPPGGTSADTENLFNETVSSDDEGEGYESINLDDIDLLEPLNFEVLVLEQLRKNGYEVQSTPTSGDCGADGLALSPEGSGMPSFIIQCKHTQTKNACSENAVKEVLCSIDAYHHISQVLTPIVITNARDFTRTAKTIAASNGVRLIGRQELVAWLKYPA